MSPAQNMDEERILKDIATEVSLDGVVKRRTGDDSLYAIRD